MDKYIDQWSAFRFGKIRRLCGYIIDDYRTKFMVSEPIVSIDPESKIITTADDTRYMPLTKIEDGSSQKMDSLYSLGRWCELHATRADTDITNLINEELEGKKDD